MAVGSTMMVAHVQSEHRLTSPRNCLCRQLTLHNIIMHYIMRNICIYYSLLFSALCANSLLFVLYIQSGSQALDATIAARHAHHRGVEKATEFMRVGDAVYRVPRSVLKELLEVRACIHRALYHNRSDPRYFRGSIGLIIR